MKSLLTLAICVFINRSLAFLVHVTTTEAPKTASEIASMYQKYLIEFEENKQIQNLKNELNIGSSVSIGAISDLDVHIVETPVFYDDDVTIAFNVEIVKGNTKSLDVDENVRRLYISVPNPEDKKRTETYLQKYMSKVLGVDEQFVNVTDITGNKKLILVPQSEIKASEAIDKVVGSLARSVLVNKTHSLTKHLKKLYNEMLDLPDKPVIMRNAHKNRFMTQATHQHNMLEIKPEITIYRKSIEDIIKSIQIEHDDKGNIVFTVERMKGSSNRILDIQASLLKIQILAPDYVSAQEAELTRYLSNMFMISRQDVILEHIVGSQLVKILLRKHSINPKNVVKRLLDEYISDGKEHNPEL